MGSVILILLLFFVLRFVFRYVLPVANAISGANRKMREMQHGGGGHNNNAGTPPPKQRSAPKQGEYIDYEEVK